MADETTGRRRLDMRVDALTRLRLQALAERLELPQAAVIRQAVRELAERHGVEVDVSAVPKVRRGRPPRQREEPKDTKQVA